MATRTFMRDKVVAGINILGLALGISCCLLIFIWVTGELNYDRNQPNADRIFRVVSTLTSTGQENRAAASSFMLAPTLKKDYPEVEEAIRLFPIHKQNIWIEDRVFQFDDSYFADSNFFSVFEHNFIEGDPKTALQEPYSIVLSSEIAQMLFGTETGLLGKTVKFTRAGYKITGVISAPKHSSHLRISSLLSMSSLEANTANALRHDWFYLAQANYVMLRHADTTGFQTKLDAVVSNYVIPWLKQENSSSGIRYYLQPLNEIHLGGDLDYDFAEITNPLYLFIFSSVAVIILLIACINYMNLATGRSVRRSKEVGIRKTAGASRAGLITQFLVESVFITFLAVLLSLCITELMLPTFNNLTDRNFTQQDLLNPGFLLLLIFVTVGVGLLAGSYPAFVLSGFSPASALKSGNGAGTGHAPVRKTLVVAQFALSVFMMICTLVVFAQMHYMKTKDIGFNKEAVMAIRVPGADSSFTNRLKEIKADLASDPSIKGVAGISQIPGNDLGTILTFVQYDGKKEERAMPFISADDDALELLGIKITKGRNFFPNQQSDDTSSFLVNEEAVRMYGWKNPLDVQMENGLGYKGKVIGVVKDFNYESLHNPIDPLVIFHTRRIPSHLIVKADPHNVPAAISFIESKWKTYSRRFPFEYTFVNDAFAKRYRAEEKMLTVFALFSFLTIAVACLGLYGLSSYSTEQRTKEIGIRKIMGAPVWRIVFMLSTDFIRPVAIGILIAMPAAWYLCMRWLESFAYQWPFSPLVFLAASLPAVAIAMLTVSIHGYRAAIADPVKALRYE